jgi:hypothetical protein
MGRRRYLDRYIDACIWTPLRYQLQTGQMRPAAGPPSILAENQYHCRSLLSLVFQYWAYRESKADLAPE